MAGRLVDGRRVGAAVPRAAAAVAVHRGVEADVQMEPRFVGRERYVHQHRVMARVGDVLGLDLVLAALRCRGDVARHATGVATGLGRVRHVARL